MIVFVPSPSISFEKRGRAALYGLNEQRTGLRPAIFDMNSSLFLSLLSCDDGESMDLTFNRHDALKNKMVVRRPLRCSCSLYKSMVPLVEPKQFGSRIPYITLVTL